MVSVDYLRKGQKGSAKVFVAKLEDDVASTDTGEPKKLAPVPPKETGSKLSQMGFSLGELDGTARTKYHLATDVQGVLITSVDPNSPAGDKNFRAGDVIVAVQSQPVHSPDDVSKRVDADAKAGKKIELLLVNREGQLAYVAMPLSDAG
jgi:serine protease Do